MIADTPEHLSEVSSRERQPQPVLPGLELEIGAGDHSGLTGISYRSKAGRSMVWLGLWLLIPLCFGLWGCASTPLPASQRRFQFAEDTFAYSNQLTWTYSYGTNGQWTTHQRDPKPDYSLHCFVVARSAYQFFETARFDPGQARTNPATYRKLVRAVLSTNPRKPTSTEKAVTIPGFADLRSFSTEYAEMLKDECGGAWQCYVQRGNWRMIFPFTLKHKSKTANRVVSRLQDGHPVLVHLVCFPELTLNHTVLLFAAKESDEAIQFQAYDPNNAMEPLVITFDRKSRRFQMPPCSYFPGGPISLYEICHRWNY
jgi:hypothetical protein